MQNINITPAFSFLSINNHQGKTYKNSVKTPSFKSAGDVFIKSAGEQIGSVAKSELASMFVKMFKKTPEELPQGLMLNVSQLSGQVLGFTKELKNGKLLKATKTAIHKNFKNYFYITLKEFKDDELLSAFAIDMGKNDIIKLKQKGTIRLNDDDFIRINPDSNDYEKYCKKLAEYMDVIYSNDYRQSTFIPMELKKKTESPAKISVDDLLDEDVVLEVPKAISKEEFYSCINNEENQEFILNEKMNQKAAAPKKTVLKKPAVVKKTINNIAVNKIMVPKHLNTPKDKKAVTKTPEQKLTKQTPIIKNNDYKIDLNAASKANVKPVIIKDSDTVKRRIDTYPYGTLNAGLSIPLLNIEQNLEKIIAILKDNRGNMQKILRLKTEYEPISYVKNGRKTLNFKLPDNNILAVIHTNTSKRFSRIIFKEASGNETHFLIENRSRIVSNLNQKQPWIVPVKFRFMSEEQIKASNIDKYIEFLNKEVPRYYRYLKENLG